MNEYKIEVANKVVSIKAQYDQSFRLSEHFLTDKEPDFNVSTSPEEIEKEWELLRTVNENTHIRYCDAEHTVILRKISEQLLDYHTLMMHGAAISAHGSAFLFLAKSGVGKTTHIMKWRERLPDAYIVNGDKPFIITGDTPMVCGSPWSGKEHICSKQIVPLKSIIMMERAEFNCIERISFADAFLVLYQQVFRPNAPDKARKVLTMLKSIEVGVTFYRFQFDNLKDDCFDVAYNALVRNQR